MNTVRHNQALPNVEKLETISTSRLLELRGAMRSVGFDAKTFLAYAGKEVTRHININDREEDYLRRQVLNGVPDLLVLVDLFMLRRTVACGDLERVLNTGLIQDLIACDFLAQVDGEYASKVFITPIGDRHYLNDGDAHNDDQGHVIQLVLEQPYLIKSAELFANDVLKKANGRILDFCSGSGVIGQGIQKAGWSINGVDINPRAIAYARMNARMNGAEDSDYRLGDVREKDVTGTYDLILANPPYNGYIPDDNTPEKKDITLHAGYFGEELPSPILDTADSLLAPGGMFLMCGITLFKDGVLWHDAVDQLSKSGTVVVLHKPILPVQSWEGQRLLFNCTPDFEKLEAGRLNSLLSTVEHFNEVTWAIIMYRKGGKPGYHNVYNLPTDAVLVSEQAADECSKLLGS